MDRNLLTINAAEGIIKDISIKKSNLNDIKLNNYEGIKLGGDKVNRLSDIAKSDFCQYGKVPSKFFYKCNPELRDDIFSEFFDSDTPIKVVSNENQIERLLGEDQPFISPRDLFAEAQSKIKAKHAQIFVDEKRGHIIFNLITDISKEPPKREGDISQCGIHVEISRPVVRAQPQAKMLGQEIRISSYILRMVCTNGLLSSDDEDGYLASGSNDREVFSNYLNHVGRCINAAENRFLPEFVNGVETPIHDPAYTVHRILRDSSLSFRQSVEHKILERVPSLGEETTMYDLVNMITSIANEFKQYDITKKLQQATGRWINITKDRCAHCQKIL